MHLTAHQYYSAVPKESMFVPVQVQMYQLSRLLHDHHKDLYDHFEMNEVAPTLYAAPWFLTIFASQFPIGFVARVFGISYTLLFVQIFHFYMIYHLLGKRKGFHPVKACKSGSVLRDPT